MSSALEKCLDCRTRDAAHGSWLCAECEQTRMLRVEHMEASRNEGKHQHVPMLTDRECGKCGAIWHIAEHGEQCPQCNPSEGNKFDTGKPRLDLIPPEVQMALGCVLEYGAGKYDARNWEKGFAWGRSIAALKRHLTAWESGQNCDPESGLPHLWHVLTNAAFLTTFEARNIGTDDRTKCAAQWLFDGGNDAIMRGINRNIRDSGISFPEAQCNPECA